MIHENHANLLERPEHRHLYDSPDIDSFFLMDSVLVTGAGGSIGSAIVNRLGLANLDKIVAVGHGEDSIFQLINSPEANSWNAEVEPVIDDAASDRILERIRGRKFSTVFHTAAHKHVGLMESNPRVAFDNNVRTTLRLAQACAESGTLFVFISTDKAVNPTTIMGASKRLAEAIVLSEFPSTSVVCRFGNVLGSAGSIVEIIRQKKARKEPVEVRRGMQRFFITAREAVGLVLTAAQSKGMFTLDMGRPVDILSLVERMNAQVTLTNPLPSEKFVEEIHTREERVVPHSVDGVLKILFRTYPLITKAAIISAEEHPEDMVAIARRV